NIPNLDIWHQQQVCIACHVTSDTLVRCALKADCVVKGKRPVNEAMPDLVTLVHFREESCIEGGLHILTYHLHSAQYGNLRHFNTKPVEAGDGVVHYCYLVLQVGCNIHRHVCHSDELVVSSH